MGGELPQMSEKERELAPRVLKAFHTLSVTSGRFNEHCARSYMRYMGTLAGRDNVTFHGMADAAYLDVIRSSTTDSDSAKGAHRSAVNGFSKWFREDCPPDDQLPHLIFPGDEPYLLKGRRNVKVESTEEVKQQGAGAKSSEPATKRAKNSAAAAASGNNNEDSVAAALAAGANPIDLAPSEEEVRRAWELPAEWRLVLCPRSPGGSAYEFCHEVDSRLKLSLLERVFALGWKDIVEASAKQPPSSELILVHGKDPRYSGIYERAKAPAEEKAEQRAQYDRLRIGSATDAPAKKASLHYNAEKSRWRLSDNPGGKACFAYCKGGEEQSPLELRPGTWKVYSAVSQAWSDTTISILRVSRDGSAWQERLLQVVAKEPDGSDSKHNGSGADEQGKKRKKKAVDASSNSDSDQDSDSNSSSSSSSSGDKKRASAGAAALKAVKGVQASSAEEEKKEADAGAPASAPVVVPTVAVVKPLPPVKEEEEVVVTPPGIEECELDQELLDLLGD